MKFTDQLAANPNYKWWVLVVVQLSIMLIGVDSTIVNLALPTIAAELNAGIADAQWTVAAFFITTAVALPMAGRLADVLGRKAVFIAGFAIFTLSSVGCGLAPNLWFLIAMRVLQAAGSAALLANSNAITLAVFPVQQHGLAMGINGTVFSLGYAMGYTLGGFFIEWFGWRSVFLVNLPIGVAAILLGMVVLVEARINTQGKAKVAFDFAGAVFSVIALAGIMIPLDRWAEAGHLTPGLLAMLGAGVLGLGAFIATELLCKSPLLDLRLFRKAPFTLGSITRVMVNCIAAAASFLIPFYTQAALGFSPIQSGLMMLPFSVALATGGPFAGRTADRFGPRYVTSAGFVCGGIALLIFGSLEATSSAAGIGPIWKVGAGMMFLGFGSGLFVAPNNSASLHSVPPDKTGAASGFIWCMSFLGSAIGTAYAAASLSSALDSKGGLEALREKGGHDTSLVDAFIQAQDKVFHSLLILSVLGFVLCLVRRSTVSSPAPNH